MAEERALARENAGHIGAEHRRDGDDDGAINQNLDPADNGHGRCPLEPLGLEQRVNQVDEQPRGNEAGQRIIENHGPYLKAGRRHKRRQSTARRTQTRSPAR
jgi:hypothetical protein